METMIPCLLGKTGVKQVVIKSTCHHCKNVIEAASAKGASRLAAHLKICPKKEEARTDEDFYCNENSRSIMDVGNSSITDLEHDEFMIQNIEFEVQKSELEKYLEEPLLNKGSPKDEFNFDILSWWKLNAPEYPTLSKIKRCIADFIGVKSDIRLLIVTESD
ncbi:zinc finger BED domain-containing protein RICESLEEPER 3-like [Papaver somniferum]|uniref:zinc finger BED domain-containing protein RICESLEEPER 3-like n=1 Tax=Papaver somniferum TaxID=3469 RepID=UPI000E6F9F27|nr:zinc finger BED domain-containing protein RICESLEEPER 3-like [Papaver somniferum]